MNDKKILILTAVGGFATQFELENIRILQEMGYTVYHASNLENPFYPLHRELLEQMGVRLYHVDIAKSPYKVFTNLRAYRELKKLIERERIEVIHCHNPVGGLLGRMLGFRYEKQGMRVIYTAHGFHFYKGAPLKNKLFFYPVERVMARATDVLITINREDYANAKKMHLKPGGRVYRIPGVGIRRERVCELQGAGEKTREQFKIPTQAFHMVSVGELNKNKNHTVVIQAISALNRNDIYYTICGEGDQKQKLRQMIQEFGLQKQVFLVGYQERVAPYLQSADVFVFPSVREGLGMAALEGMAMGLPVIAAKNRGTVEYVRDGKNGYFCSWNRRKDFENAIMKLYENPNMCKKMGEAARKTATHFTLEETTKKMRAIYQELLNEE